VLDASVRWLKEAKKLPEAKKLELVATLDVIGTSPLLPSKERQIHGFLGII
jgi:hypothetical protein